MKFSFGQHDVMTESLGEKIYMAKCNVIGFPFTAIGKTQAEANDHLTKMFKDAIENGYNQYLTTFNTKIIE